MPVSDNGGLWTSGLDDTIREPLCLVAEDGWLRRTDEDPSTVARDGCCRSPHEYMARRFDGTQAWLMEDRGVAGMMRGGSRVGKGAIFARQRIVAIAHEC
jgi:hypothetical protein